MDLDKAKKNFCVEKVVPEPSVEALYRRAGLGWLARPVEVELHAPQLDPLLDLASAVDLPQGANNLLLAIPLSFAFHGFLLGCKPAKKLTQAWSSFKGAGRLSR